MSRVLEDRQQFGKNIFKFFTLNGDKRERNLLNYYFDLLFPICPYMKVRHNP